jgi:hypothetical protein
VAVEADDERHPSQTDFTFDASLVDLVDEVEAMGPGGRRASSGVRAGGTG